MIDPTEIQRIKNGTIMRSPYYGSLLPELEIIEDPSVETACTDGSHLWYSPEYLMSLDFERRVGLFAHEVDHCARNHHTRRGNREPELYNVAADFSVNGELRRDGFKLPEGALYEARFVGMPVERIYNILDQEREKKRKEQQQQQGSGDQGKGQNGQGQPQPGQPGQGQPQPGQGQPKAGDKPSPGPGGKINVGGCGGVIDPQKPDGTALSKDELTRERTRWDSAVRHADSVAKRIGKAAGSALTTIRQIQDGVLDWKDEMRQFMYRAIDEKYSWLSGDRRFIDDFWMPNREHKRLGEVIIGIDTSGSLSVRQLGIVKPEVNLMIDDVNPERVHVVFWDTIVQKNVTYEDSEYPVDFDFPGRGGTAVQSFFRWVEDSDINPVCALIFSDMEINDFGVEPDYPVLWGDLKGKHAAPYGTQIDLSGI